MLHGRGKQCAVVDELLSKARNGHGGALVIRGEAGIGKTALIEYAAEHASDMLVLKCPGLNSESDLQFAGIQRLLWPVRANMSSLPVGQRELLRRAVALGEAADRDRLLISVGVLALLVEIAQGKPLLCLLDDAHWLDQSSAHVLAFAAQRLGADSIAMLFAASDDDAATLHPARLPEMRLPGLDQAAATALLADAVSVGLSPAVCQALLEETAGNPLGLLEISAGLSMAQLTGQHPLPEPIDVGARVEQAFIRQVRRQPPAVQMLLLVAAAEDKAELRVVLPAARALGIGPEILDQAQAAGLLRVDGTEVSFSHPLVRGAVYRGAPSGQRRAVHKALAAALEGDDAADRRAWHLAAATTGPDDAVAEALEWSADQARHRGGYGAAARAWRRAADLTAAPEPRARRLVAAAHGAALAGQPGLARDLLERASHLTRQVPVRADINHQRGFLELTGGLPVEAYAVFAAGAELIISLDPARAGMLLAEASQAAWTAGDLTRLAEAGRRLTNLQTPDGGVVAVAQMVVGLGSLLRGETASAVLLLRKGVRQAEDSGQLHALRLAAGVAMFTGDDERAEVLLAGLAARARAEGAVGALPVLLAPLASLQMWSGRHAAASASANEGLRLALDAGQHNPAAHHRGVLAWIAAVEGRVEECRDAASTALALAVDHHLGAETATATWALALSDLGMGRPAEAMERLRRLVADGPGSGHPLVTVFASADLVEAAVRAGRPDQARAALATLEDWSSRTGAISTGALAARCRALVPTSNQTDGHFTEALALHSQGCRPFDTARTELLYGQHLRRSRRKTESRSYLQAAVEGFERLGAKPWAQLARAELRASGVTVSKHDSSATSRLTSQELQILRLVGQGATNREVAAQLFLSPRTVGYHLHKIFTKLGISSRTELVRLQAHEPAPASASGQDLAAGVDERQE